jgi:hypothetical protein
MRMFFEVVMVLGLIGAIFFMNKILSEENKLSVGNKGQDSQG